MADLLGHQPGIRSNDILARLGGDAFGVLQSRCPLELAKRLADSIRGALQDFRFAWDGQIFALGVSIGMLQIDDGSEGAIRF